MSERLSIVVPSEMNKKIEKLQKILNMDKCIVIRHLIQNQLESLK